MNIQEVKELGAELMATHRVNDWNFKLDRGLRRFGYCDYRKKTISISEHLASLNTIDHVKDTILHEIAHIKAGTGQGHRRKWQYIALSIGCNGQRTYDNEVMTPIKKYEGTCPKCGKITQRYRKIATLSCKNCCVKFNHGKWSNKFIFIWKLIERG